jgi:hypothetical protein
MLEQPDLSPPLFHTTTVTHSIWPLKNRKNRRSVFNSLPNRIHTGHMTPERAKRVFLART